MDGNSMVITFLHIPKILITNFLEILLQFCFGSGEPSLAQL